MKCLHCGRTVVYQKARGWVHAGPDGKPRGSYMMRCDNCGYADAPYPSPVACPCCGAFRAWRDDYCAAPDHSMQPVGGCG